jgi:SprT-like protein
VGLGGVYMDVLVLTKIAEKFLKKEYNLDLTVPIEVSGRMKSTLGYFKYKKNKPVVVKLSKNLLDFYHEDAVLDVLKHELIHYACFVQKKPFHDGDLYFKNELKRLGVSKTRTYKHKGIVYRYQCKNGCQTFTKRMKGYEKKYICRHCKGKFLYIGEEITK